MGQSPSADCPRSAERQTQAELGPGVTRLKLDGPLQITNRLLAFPFVGQGLGKHHDHFDRARCLLENFAVFSNGPIRFARRQQGAGQADRMPMRRLQLHAKRHWSTASSSRPAAAGATANCV